MSLINEMLRDLETRREPAQRSALPDAVRPLPPARASLAPKLLALVLTGAALAVGGWAYVALTAGKPNDRVAAPALAVPLAAPAPLQAPQPVAQSAAPVKSAVPTPSAQAKPSPPTRAPDAAARKAEIPRAEAAQAARAPADLKIATVLAPPRTSGTDAPRPESMSLPGKAEGETVIEKKVRAATARERAENEYRKALAAGAERSAEAGLRTALSEDPSHTGARLALANLLVDQARLEEAQALLQEGLARKAEPAVALKLARIQVERGDLRAAEETLGRHAVSAPGNGEYLALHAGVLQRLGEHRRAAEAYQAALRLAPQAGVWWMGLGISLEAEGRGAEARDAYGRARAAGSLSAELDRYVEQRLRQMP